MRRVFLMMSLLLAGGMGFKAQIVKPVDWSFAAVLMKGKAGMYKVQ